MEPQSIAVTPWLHPPWQYYSMLFLISLSSFLQIFMFTKYILVRLNGKPFNCIESLLLSELLLYLNIHIDSSIIEYNSQIVQESLLDKIILKHGDNIEILTVVGGG